ncbi:latent-transforming growth factor beta-binding protein 2 [Erinaceus europaeus]|uniref:Latent-transforming growth factor beta-binding protein 2 n=1 Tax=Erinaceus europaeus TaxID=9365 RepID=A0ABM3WL35_ERIEU|nr:latent-transforming growth factor beta-binding protein 2 [Erinaceus europaeus]
MRTHRGPWRSLLPLAVVLLLGAGQVQGDPAVGTPTRLRRPSGSPPAAKVLSPAPEPVGEPRVPRAPPPGWRRGAPGQRPLAPRPRSPQTPGAAPPSATRVRLSGRNVCRGQCCPGWTTANSTNHCIKPVCQPPCQNRGSCSRPQLCVCRSGFRGAHCEEVIPEEEFDPKNARPGPRRSAEDLPSLHRSSAARGNSGLRTQPPAARPLTRTLGALSQTRPSQQHVGLSRTVHMYLASSAKAQQTSNALTSGLGLEQRDGAQQAVDLDHSSSSWGLNLTEKIRKIKIVFTPTVCRQSCAQGRCTHSCERGRTTTLYSQGGRTPHPDPARGFRVYFCQIPCLNGGRCVGRDECRCPANATGRFCHLPAPGTVHPGSTRPRHQLEAASSRQSTFTLPLSNQLASLNPSLVKVHIHHPPETSVQVHQVARVQAEAPENSLETRPPGWTLASPHSHWDSNSLPSARHAGPPPPALPENPRPRGLLGRCYLNAVSGQCAHPLLELTAQEDCCGSVGAFWGVTSCAPCPPKPAFPMVENGQLECPTGYKRLNLTHCQDINECLTLGLCRDSQCVNTRGSFLCTCRPGLMLDPSRSRCVSDKAVSMQQGLCFRSSGPGGCALPLAQRITKQICCCSRVGKAWGSECESCPLPGTEAFREICPAGHGYTYSSSDIRLSMRKAEEAELARPSREPGQKSRASLPGLAPRQPLRETTGTWLDVGTTPAEGDSQAGQVMTSVSQAPAWLPGRPTLPPPKRGTQEAWREEPVTSSTREQEALGAPEIDRCGSGATNICGPGTCVNLPDGHRCICHPGYRLHPSQAYCTDDNECLRDPCLGRGRCVNHVGSYSCFCYPGYITVSKGPRQECQDIDECEQPGVCTSGQCTNTVGSYHCECDQGYVMIRKDHCQDIDECREPGACPHGRCLNSPGSFTCLACEEGYRAQSGSCVDVDECASRALCPSGSALTLKAPLSARPVRVGTG